MNTPNIAEWVWCERYGCRLIGHRDALDGSPRKPICTARHYHLVIGAEMTDDE